MAVDRMDLKEELLLSDVVKEEGYGQLIEVKQESFSDSYVNEFVKNEEANKPYFYCGVPSAVIKEELKIKKEEEEDNNQYGIPWDESSNIGPSSEDDFSLIDLINSSYISYDSCESSSTNNNIPLGYTCHHCFYTTKWKQKLRNHIITNHLTEINRVWCLPCQISFRKTSSLKKHQADKHQISKKIYKCSHCPFIAKRGLNLKVHIDSVHNNKRPFGCPHCLYSASRSGTLKRHIRSFHSNERPFTCPYCDYDATRSYTIKMHIQTVHKSKKPCIQCSECSYITNHARALAKHISLKHKLNEN